MILPLLARLVALLGVLAFSGLAVTYLKLLAIERASDVLTIVNVAGFVSLLALPIIWIVRPSQWPAGIPLIVAGLISSTALQVAAIFVGARRHTMLGFINLGIPFAALAGMGLFLWAVLHSQGKTSFADNGGPVP